VALRSLLRELSEQGNALLPVHFNQEALKPDGTHGSLYDSDYNLPVENALRAARIKLIGYNIATARW
jgi:hypothetical protein